MGNRDRLATMLLAFLLLIGFVQPSAATSIFVTTTIQGNSNGGCSLQEAIQAANFDANIAIGSTSPDSFYTTGCQPGNGDDTIILPDNGSFEMDSVWDDAHNYMGPTATPIIFTTTTIEANGSTIFAGPNAPNMRAFALGPASINTPTGTVASTGTVTLTIRNAYIKGFHVKGGDGESGGGGGLGAGGAIYAEASFGNAFISLNIENSTFDSNAVYGGNGSLQQVPGFISGPGGGGGGLGGNGGFAFLQFAITNAPGGGGGGARGSGGSNGGSCNTCTFPGIWIGFDGGGGGGTVFSGNDGYSEKYSSWGAGGFACGGNGPATDDGQNATCPGGGGGGGGNPGDTEHGSGGNGGNGAYGGGGAAGAMAATRSPRRTSAGRAAMVDGVEAVAPADRVIPAAMATSAPAGAPVAAVRAAPDLSEATAAESPVARAAHWAARSSVTSRT